MNKKNFTKILALIVVLIVIAWIGLSNGSTHEDKRIGVILSLTGPAQFFGTEMKNGMDLANDEEKLNLFFEDSAGDVKTGISAYRKLKDIDGIDAAIVAISGVAGGVIPVAESDKIPVIQTLVSAKKISDSDYSFRYFTSAEQEAPIMARFASENLKLKNVAVINVNDDYGRAYASVFKENVEALGGKVSVIETFEKKDGDFKTQILKVKAANPEGVYVIGLDSHLSIFFKQAHDMGLDSVMMTNWVMASPAVQEKVGQYSEGLYLTTPKYYLENSKQTSDFFVAYEKRFGSKPSAYAAIGYDLVKIMSDVVESNEDVLPALRNLENVPGLMGNLSADDSGEITFPLFPVKIEGGELKVVE